MCRPAATPNLLTRAMEPILYIRLTGVLVSDNIEALSCKTVDTAFAYGYHNAENLKFVLKPD